MIEVREYVDSKGQRPFARWLDRLSPKAAAKVTMAIARVGLGNFSNVKGVGGGVYERKIGFGPGYRVYFGKDGSTTVVLLAGGTKARQQKGVDTARARWADYRKRKRKGET